MSNALKKLVKNSNQALFIGLHLLSNNKRQAMYSVYAYARHLNDITASSRPKDEKIELLNAWKDEINRIFSFDTSSPQSEIGSTMQKNLRPYTLLKSDFLSLLDSKLRYLSSDHYALSKDEYPAYCYSECGAFISSALRILGCKDNNLINKLSQQLGIALQTTIILRDVKDNAALGSLYIPQDFLDDAGIFERDPYMVLADNNLAKARGELSKIGAQAFARAFLLMPQLNKKIAARLKSVAYLYKYCFDAMENRGWEVITPKPQAGCLTQMRLVCKAYLEK